MLVYVLPQQAAAYCNGALNMALATFKLLSNPPLLLWGLCPFLIHGPGLFWKPIVTWKLLWCGGIFRALMLGIREQEYCLKKILGNLVVPFHIWSLSWMYSLESLIWEGRAEVLGHDTSLPFHTRDLCPSTFSYLTCLVFLYFEFACGMHTNLRMSCCHPHADNHFMNTHNNQIQDCLLNHVNLICKFSHYDQSIFRVFSILLSMNHIWNLLWKRRCIKHWGRILNNLGS